jgi:hypothetical protein
MTEMLLILSVLVLIAAAAPRYGVDTRSAVPGRRVRPTDDVRALARAVAGRLHRPRARVR